MHLYEHGSENCNYCTERLWYGVKQEASGWKVYYICDSGCGRETMTGRIPLSSVSSTDEVHERAELMTPTK